MNDGYYDGCGLLSLHTTTDDMNKIGSLPPWGFHPSRYALCYYHYTYEGQPLVVAPGKGAVVTINQDPTGPAAIQHSIRFTDHDWPSIWKSF